MVNDIPVVYLVYKSHVISAALCVFFAELCGKRINRRESQSFFAEYSKDILLSGIVISEIDIR
jgi:hypothetical protein